MEMKIKKKERREPGSEPNMRYFKIPLCRIFTETSKIDQGQMMCVSGILGQKLGYDNYK